MSEVVTPVDRHALLAREKTKATKEAEEEMKKLLRVAV